MNDGQQLVQAYWNVLQKMMWLDKYRMNERLREFKPSQIHCIEYVEEHRDSNVTKLADAFYMTRGAITKITKALIKKGLLESYRKEDNKKELYFALTKEGKKIYQIHEALHEEFKQRDQMIFDQLDEKQFEEMVAFAHVYQQHLEKEIKKLGLSMKPDIL